MIGTLIDNSLLNSKSINYNILTTEKSLEDWYENRLKNDINQVYICVSNNDVYSHYKSRYHFYLTKFGCKCTNYDNKNDIYRDSWFSII